MPSSEKPKNVPSERLATGSSRLKTGERLATGSSTTSTTASRPNTNATLLPPIVEYHHHHAPSPLSSMPMGSSGPGADAYERPVGLKKTTTQTNMKLGFYSEYKPGEAANGRTLGSYGYTSPTYTELRPAVPAARSPGKLSSGTATGPGPKALRGGRSLLTERDVDLLRERDADNQQVFEVWSQRKQLEQQLSHEERERRRAESLARFEQREAELKEANDAALRQWTERKVRQHRADAEDSYMRQIQMKAMAAYRQRMQAEYESKCKALEQGFALRVPQPLPPALARALNPDGSVGSGSSVNGAGGRGGRGAGGKAASAGARAGGIPDGANYKALLDELDRHAAHDAAILAQLETSKYTRSHSQPQTHPHAPGRSLHPPPLPPHPASLRANGAGSAGKRSPQPSSSTSSLPPPHGSQHYHSDGGSGGGRGPRTGPLARGVSSSSNGGSPVPPAASASFSDREELREGASALGGEPSFASVARQQAAAAASAARAGGEKAGGMHPDGLPHAVNGVHGVSSALFAAYGAPAGSSSAGGSEDRGEGDGDVKGLGAGEGSRARLGAGPGEGQEEEEHEVLLPPNITAAYAPHSLVQAIAGPVTPPGAAGVTGEQEAAGFGSFDVQAAGREEGGEGPGNEEQGGEEERGGEEREQAAGEEGGKEDAEEERGEAGLAREQSRLSAEAEAASEGHGEELAGQEEAGEEEGDAGAAGGDGQEEEEDEDAEEAAARAAMAYVGDYGAEAGADSAGSTGAGVGVRPVSPGEGEGTAAGAGVGPESAQGGLSRGESGVSAAGAAPALGSGSAGQGSMAPGSARGAGSEPVSMARGDSAIEEAAAAALAAIEEQEQGQGSPGQEQEQDSPEQEQDVPGRADSSFDFAPQAAGGEGATGGDEAEAEGDGDGDGDHAIQHPEFSKATPPEVMPPSGLGETSPGSGGGASGVYGRGMTGLSDRARSSAGYEASIAGSVPGMMSRGVTSVGDGDGGMDGDGDDDDDLGPDVELPRWDDDESAGGEEGEGLRAADSGLSAGR